MTEKFQGIVLDIVRHSDRHNIVTLFTRTRGRVSFLSAAGGGKSGRVRQSRLQPLAVIEGDYIFRGNAELQKLGSFSMHRVWSDIYFHPVKRLIAIFLSEFLNRLLRASMPDEALWDYIVGSLSLLDNMKSGIADFHITFLASLLPFVGIQPDHTQYTKGSILDMLAGQFTDRVPSHRDYLQGNDAKLAARLCRVNFSNTRALRLNGELRHRILSTLLRYYGIHYPGTASLKSLEIIHEIFQ